MLLLFCGPVGAEAWGFSARPAFEDEAAQANARSGGTASRDGSPDRWQSTASSRFHGWAFDTCEAPSADTMRRWKASPYRAVGVYFGGRGRACRIQPHLSHGWMRTVRGMGWRVLPLYVGSQATCVIGKSQRDVSIGKYPWRQGTLEARDAVRRAEALGIGSGSPLYLDMEAYRYQNRRCASVTLTFVQGWDREVRRRGYVPGFYSSAGTGVRHMDSARRAGARDLPSVVWFARWGTPPRLNGESLLHADAWAGQRRIHQYAGDVRERHGGRTLVIDRNLVNAPVARVT